MPNPKRNKATGRFDGNGGARRELMSVFPGVHSPRQRRWLAAFLCTGEIRETARLAGFAWPNHYRWLLKDKAYAAAFDRAKEIVMDFGEDELHRRGVRGFPKPIIYKGKITGTYLDYSDVCLALLLKANRPTKYRDSLVNLTSNAPALINITLGAVADKPIQPAIDGPDGGDGPIEAIPTISMG